MIKRTYFFHGQVHSALLSSETKREWLSGTVTMFSWLPDHDFALNNARDACREQFGLAADSPIEVTQFHRVSS